METYTCNHCDKCNGVVLHKYKFRNNYSYIEDFCSNQNYSFECLKKISEETNYISKKSLYFLMRENATLESALYSLRNGAKLGTTILDIYFFGHEKYIDDVLDNNIISYEDLKEIFNITNTDILDFDMIKKVYNHITNNKEKYPNGMMWN